MRIPLGIVSAALLATCGAFAQQYNISTLAGGAPLPTPATALNSPLGTPGAVTTDPAGNVYFVGDDCVFEINTSGILTRVAGNSRLGFSGDGGAATQAQLNAPGGLAADNAGNLYIADSANNRIRRVTLGNGAITTIAGIGTAGYSGDNGAASAAALSNPQGLALDSSGNLYIADTANNVIRKIVSGSITTIAGNGTAGVSGDGQPATSAQLNMPVGVAVDSSLNVYIGDTNNNRIRKIQSGIISTIAGNGVAGFLGDGGLATGSELNLPTVVAVDPANQVYIDDSNNQRVRKITTNGVITTLAGGTSGILSMPAGFGVDSSGNLYVSDSNLAQILKFSLGGAITTFAGTGIRYALGDGGPATSAQLVQPQGLAVNSTGLFIADRGEARIRQVVSGNINSPAGGTARGPAAVALDTSGNFYIADAVGNQVLKVAPGGASTVIAGTGAAGSFGDNGPATVAQLNQPSGVAIDSLGNIYIADTANNRIRKITNGIIVTLAGNGAPTFGGDGGVSTNAQVNQPTGLVVDSAGNLYIADTGNNRIRKITPAGIISTLAGNGNNAYSGDGAAATAAGISSPHGVAVDPLGNLYISDQSGRVRKVSISGLITTIAGTGTSGYSGDGGAALNAQLAMPWGVAVDSSGATCPATNLCSVYVSDLGEQAVRVLSPVASPPLSVLTASPLPSGTAGVPYAQALSASGGAPPYSWSIIFGTLPSGLTLSPSGSITGTPTAAGSSLLTFQVTDSASVTATATIGIVIAAGGTGGLTITTPPTLVPGAVGVFYSQPLTAASGNPPYTWTVIGGTLPPGLTLSSTGLISGTPQSPGTYPFTIRVNDVSGSVTSLPVSLTVISPGTLTRTGVLAHIAIGGTWTTTIYLTNISTAPVAVDLIFRDDNGNPLTVPFNVNQQGSTQQVTTNSFNGVLNPNTSLVIEGGDTLPNLFTGWIDVQSSGTPNSLAGFAVFRTTAANGTVQEGTAPLQSNFEAKMDLQFDDTGSFLTGVAVVNLAPTAATITATILDVNGNQIGTYSLPLAANGHTAFELPQNFAVTTAKQGIVLFQNTSGGGVAGVGLRASTSAGTFTSVPVILP